jgi:3-oxoacyl-[acyl-carrier-protein] synthase II
LTEGTGIDLPGAEGIGALLTGSPAGAQPFDPGAVLGRKGLRYTDRATQLAFCAAQAALIDAGLLDEILTVPAADVAVLVASNLGNLGTVCRVVSTIAEEDGTSWLSPMDTPNASSNVTASAVALRFGLRGPNLMVCNGPTSGIDALRWAALTVTSGRARHALVIGVEPDDDVTRRMLGTDRVIDGAIAAVIELAATAQSRDAPQKVRIDGFTRAGGVRQCLTDLDAQADNAALFVPQTRQPLPADVLAGAPRFDLSQRWGPASGALGVLQCAAAVAHFAKAGTGVVYAIAGGDEDDASAGMVLRPAEVAP